MGSLSNMGGGNPSGFELRENIPESKQVPWLSKNSKWLEKPIVSVSLPSHDRKRPFTLSPSSCGGFEHQIHWHLCDTVGSHQGNLKSC